MKILELVLLAAIFYCQLCKTEYFSECKKLAEYAKKKVFSKLGDNFFLILNKMKVEYYEDSDDIRDIFFHDNKCFYAYGCM